MPEPGFREAIVAMRFDERADCIEVAALRGGREGERNRPETEVEQSVAERRLAVIVALGRSARDDLDLAIIESEALIDAGDLRPERALVGEEQPRRAALDDGGRDRWALDVGEALRCEDEAGVLLPQRLQPFLELPAEQGSPSTSQPSSIMIRHGRPARRRPQLGHRAGSTARAR